VSRRIVCEVARLVVDQLTLKSTELLDHSEHYSRTVVQQHQGQYRLCILSLFINGSDTALAGAKPLRFYIGKASNFGLIWNSIKTGPSTSLAFWNVSYKSAGVSARKAGQPYASAMATALRPGRFKAAVQRKCQHLHLITPPRPYRMYSRQFGVSSKTANSFRIAYSSFLGTRIIILTFCCTAVYMLCTE
jgi:hypothetical protein